MAPRALTVLDLLHTRFIDHAPVQCHEQRAGVSQVS
jgi:hypothetical protein